MKSLPWGLLIFSMLPAKNHSGYECRGSSMYFSFYFLFIPIRINLEWKKCVLSTPRGVLRTKLLKAIYPVCINFFSGFNRNGYSKKLIMVSKPICHKFKSQEEMVFRVLPSFALYRHLGETRSSDEISIIFVFTPRQLGSNKGTHDKKFIMRVDDSQRKKIVRRRHV